MEREFTTDIENQPKREKLSDFELGDLLASVGNHEAKALTLILMSGGNIYTAADINHKLIVAQGENAGWRMNKTTPFSYCSASLEPIGLVAKETLEDDLDIYGYQITQKGEELGVALSGLLLDYSLRRNVSLQDLFGETKSPAGRSLQLKESDNGNGSNSKVRAPLTRYQIFYELVTNPSNRIRLLDLSQSNFGYSKVLGKHLLNLAKADVLGYDVVQKGQPQTYYKAVHEKITNDRYKVIKGRPNLTREIFYILRSDLTREWTINDMTEEIKMHHEVANEKALSATISSLLSAFKNQGFVTVRKFSMSENFLSEVTLDNKQREVLCELVDIIDKFASLDDQTLEKGRRLAFDIINNPELVRILMLMAREHSSYASSKPFEERKKQILSVILARPAISAKGIVSALEEQGEIVSQETVRRISKLLLAEGLIKSETKKEIMHFRVVEK